MEEDEYGVNKGNPDSWLPVWFALIGIPLIVYLINKFID